MLRQRKRKFDISGLFARQLVKLGAVLRVNLLQVYPHLVLPARLVAAEVAAERLLAEVDNGDVTLRFVLPAKHLKKLTFD